MMRSFVHALRRSAETSVVVGTSVVAGDECARS